MECLIKRTTLSSSNSYFRLNIDEQQNAWVYKENARIFKSVFEAKETIKKYKLKKVTIEKIYKYRKGVRK